MLALASALTGARAGAARADYRHDVGVGEIEVVSGNLAGDAALVKSGGGTLALAGKNSFTGGTVITGGAIILGGKTALGSWQGGDPATSSNGSVRVAGAGGGGRIIVTNNLEIKNHFRVGIYRGSGSVGGSESAGSLAFDVAEGATLAIRGVTNGADRIFSRSGSHKDGNLLYPGGAVGVTVAGGCDALKLAGRLAFADNRAHYGGAIGAFFSRGAEALDLGGASAISFIANSARSDGGAVMTHDGGLSVGSNAWFCGNSASSGGAIASSRVVALRGNTFFNGNFAAHFGGAIYLGGNDSSAGTAELDASGGDIAFSGNTARGKIGANGNMIMRADRVFGRRAADGGANSIFMGQGAALAISGGNNVYFDDPVIGAGGNNLAMRGGGFAQFAGENRFNTARGGGAAGGAAGGVDIVSGVLRVVEGAIFDADCGGGKNANACRINIGVDGALAGGGVVIAPRGGLHVAGRISPDSDRFEIPEFVHMGHAEAADGRIYNYFKPGRSAIDPAKRFGVLTFKGGGVVFAGGAVLELDIGDGACDSINIVGGDRGKGRDSNCAVEFDDGIVLKLNLAGASAGEYTFFTADSMNFSYTRPLVREIEILNNENNFRCVTRLKGTKDGRVGLTLRVSAEDVE